VFEVDLEDFEHSRWMMSTTWWSWRREVALIAICTLHSSLCASLIHQTMQLPD